MIREKLEAIGYIAKIYINMASKKKIVLKWSNRENDWKFYYPDNAGCLMMGVFFDIIKTTGHRIDWKEDLNKMLTDRGYDYKTLKITCEKINDKNKTI